MSEPLGWLALARGTLDRVAERRKDDAWLAEAWADPRTRVFPVEQGRALVRTDGPELVFFTPGEAPPGDRYLLGVDGVAYFAVAGPLPSVEGTEPADLRMVGAQLSDRDSGLLTHAVGLENWHTTHQFCPRCGARTDLASAGHTRVCPIDESEHFPRVDPAVIMLVHDPDDRILLARGALWPSPRASVLAGFVEPGESLEQAVAREVHEEVSVTVQDVQYRGSQPWPLPRSLMVGFFAHAPNPEQLHPDGEEIKDARWYSRAELMQATQAGTLKLPNRVSIARQLIESWYGAPLPSDW